ncbi:MAG TPA: hypothetical protein VFR81_03030 [Longimicrobium sp.]|nr:hypothetical protein [Longimicrobium sp.]
MPTKKKRFREVLPPFHPPVHFTLDEARRAVRTVMQRHGIDPVAMEREAEASAWADEAEHCARGAA